MAFPVLFLALNRAIIHSVAFAALLTVFFAANFARIRHFYWNARILPCKTNGDTRFRARFSQSLIDRQGSSHGALSCSPLSFSYPVCKCTPASSWRLFDVIFVFGPYLRVAREIKKENGGGGGEIQHLENFEAPLPVSCLPYSSVAFWFNLGSAFARLYLFFTSHKSKKTHQLPGKKREFTENGN